MGKWGLHHIFLYDIYVPHMSHMVTLYFAMGHSIACFTWCCYVSYIGKRYVAPPNTYCVMGQIFLYCEIFTMHWTSLENLKQSCVREIGVSRHHGIPVSGPSETLIEYHGNLIPRGSRGALKRAHYAERRQSLGQPRGIFFHSGHRIHIYIYINIYLYIHINVCVYPSNYVWEYFISTKTWGP